MESQAQKKKAGISKYDYAGIYRVTGESGVGNPGSLSGGGGGIWWRAFIETYRPAMRTTTDESSNENAKPCNGGRNLRIANKTARMVETARRMKGLVN